MRIVSGKFEEEEYSHRQNALYKAYHRHRERRVVQYPAKQDRLEGIRTLDLFGGTGSISYELASRGAGEIVIVEKDVNMHAFIKTWQWKR